jgi:hypothetical protein
VHLEKVSQTPSSYSLKTLPNLEDAHGARIGPETMKKTWQALDERKQVSPTTGHFYLSDNRAKCHCIRLRKMTTYFSNQCHVYSLTLAVHESGSEGQV